MDALKRGVAQLDVCAPTRPALSDSFVGVDLVETFVAVDFVATEHP